MCTRMGQQSTRGRTGLTALVALMSLPAAADPGDHVRLGSSGELIPTLQTAIEYQTNPYLEEGGEGAEPDPGVALRVTPRVDLNLSTEELNLSLSSAFGIRQYFNPLLAPLNRYSDVDLALGVNLLPHGAVGLKLQDDLSNRSRAAEINADAALEAGTLPDSANINHLSNTSLAQVSIHPGTALTVDVGAHVLLDGYRIPEGIISATSVQTNQKIGFGPDLDVNWRFFPKTAIVADGSMEFFNWRENLIETGGNSELGDYVGKPDGWSARMAAGLRGRLTEKTLIGLLVGYGGINYDPDSVAEGASGSEAAAELDGTSAGYDLDLKGAGGILAIAEGSWTPSENHNFTLGVRHDFSDVYFTNYVNYFNVFARYQGRYFERLGVQTDLTWRLENYRGEVTRDDAYVRGRLDLAWRTLSWMDIGAGMIWSHRGNRDGDHPEVDYSNLAIIGGVTLTY